MTTSTDGRTTVSERLAGQRRTAAFETAQHALFDSVGLDTKSSIIDLDSPSVRIHVFEAGQPTGEPPAVFVHATDAFGAFFAPLMAQFDDVWMIGFDRPGYGLSDPFEYTEQNVRQTAVDVLEGVLDELGIEEVDFVGHSMGGHTGISFANSHPERVRNLILVGAVPAFPGTRPPLPIRLLTTPVLNRVMRRLQTPNEASVLRIADTFGERDAIQNYPAFIDAIVAHERDSKSADAGFSEFNAVVSAVGWRSSVRITETELRGVTPPTTIIWGTHDTLGTPDDVREGIELLPNARFETVETGHIPFLARPERCAQLIRDARDEKA